MRPWVRAGLVAAVFSGAPSTVIGLARGDDLLASTEAVGEVLLGGRVPQVAKVTAGGIGHLLISLFWARLLAIALRDRSPSDAVGCGALAGVGIAALDLAVVGRRLPAIRALPGGPLLADHLAYGALVGWSLSRRRPPHRTV